MKKLLELYFSVMLNKTRITNYIEKSSSFRDGNLSLESKRGLSEGIKISCVQRTIRPVKKVENFIDLLESFLQEAAQEKSQLVVFPEYNFFDLFGLLPGFNRLNAKLNQKAKKLTASEKDSEGNLTSFIYLLSAIAKPIQIALETICSNLAKKYGINLYTGSYIIKEGQHLYNAGALITKDGVILGTQKKLHLTAFENQLKLKRDVELKTFPLDIGRVACPICMDATYFETFFIARNLEADIIILPIANNEEYHPYKALRGLWPRVQESYVYGLKGALTGWLGGMHFTGKAGIFAPLEITEKKDGVIAISEAEEGDYLVSGLVDLSKLYEARSQAEYYGDINEDFEKHYQAVAYGLLKEKSH